MEQRPEQGQLTEMVLEGHGLLSLINGDTHVDTKRGRILNLTSSGEACMAGLTNSEIRSNHIGWSENKKFLTASGWCGQSCPRPLVSSAKVSPYLKRACLLSMRI